MSLQAKNEAQAQVALQMQALRKRYVEKLEESLSVIEAGIDACDTADMTPEQRETIRTCAHRLAGTGTTYGFAAISTTARALDDVLKATPMIPVNRLKPLLERLYDACSEARSQTTDMPAQPGFGHRQGQGATQVALKPRKLPILLAADDDEAILSLFGQLFADQFEVITARHAEEALRLMRLYRPDIVLLDDIMPGSITGLKFLEFLQRSGEFATMPILMVTASDAEADITRGLNAGARGYVTKPFDAVEVKQKVQAILARG
jgi:twitching motility two-component system response regulator PilH